MRHPDHLIDQSFAPQLMCDIRHSVSRAIIDDDNLQTIAFAEGLLGKTADTGAQRSGFVGRNQLVVATQPGGRLRWQGDGGRIERYGTS